MIHHGLAELKDVPQRMGVSASESGENIVFLENGLLRTFLVRSAYLELFQGLPQPIFQCILCKLASRIFSKELLIHKFPDLLQNQLSDVGPVATISGEVGGIQ